MSADSIDLLALGLDWAKAVSEDLSGLVGSNVRLKPPQVSVVDRSEVAGSAEHIALTVCRTKDDAGDAVHLIVPRPEAITLAAVLMGFPKERVDELRSGGLDEESLDAYGEVMNLGVSVLGRILQEKGDFPALQREDTTEVSDPASDPSWLPDGEYRVVHFPTVLEGYPDGEFRLVIGQELANRWFGAAVSSGEEEEEGEKKASGDDEDEDRHVALLDPDEDARLCFEELEEELGRPILVLDPASFELDMMEELAESSAIVLSWDLGGRPGLELLETLLHDDRTRRIPVALASEAPTRPMVSSAIRYGATTFLSKPWLVEEVRGRLFPGMRAPTQAEPVSEEGAATGSEAGDVAESADGEEEASHPEASQEEAESAPEEEAASAEA